MTATETVVSTDTAEDAAFRDEVRAFLAANAAPAKDLSPWALHFHTSAEAAAADFERGRQWQSTLFEHGLAGLTYPKEFGGRGGPPSFERIFADESAGYDARVGFISATMAMLGPTLMKFGSDEQKAHYLPKMLSGEYAFCQLFSEPGAGSDLAGLACRAIRDGDEFVITGQKVWNSAAQFCNWGFLLVRTDPDVPKHKGITFILVDMSSPGIDVRPLVQPNGASEFNEVFFEEVRVPVANVVGDINAGWAAARTVLSNESAFIGGGGHAASTVHKLRLLADEFDQRDNPLVRQQMAVAYTRERLLLWMGSRIMQAVRRREVPPVDPSVLKLFVAQNKVQSGELAMLIAGSAGIAGGDEIASWVQNESIGRFGISIGGGTNEVQRNNLAERALGLPKEIREDHLKPWKDVPRG